MKSRNLIQLLLMAILLPSCHQHVALMKDPDFKKNRVHAAEYNTQLGLAYLKEGQRIRAKRKLLKAISQAPKSPHALAAMAYYMEKAGDSDKAQFFYKKAMALAPGQGSQLNNYGAFLCRLGQYQEAERYFLKAIDDPNYENTAGAYENAGVCAAQIPDYVKAKRYLMNALHQDPMRKQSLIELENINNKLGLNQKSLAQLQVHP